MKKKNIILATATAALLSIGQANADGDGILEQKLNSALWGSGIAPKEQLNEFIQAGYTQVKPNEYASVYLATTDDAEYSILKWYDKDANGKMSEGDVSSVDNYIITGGEFRNDELVKTSSMSQCYWDPKFEAVGYSTIKGDETTTYDKDTEEYKVAVETYKKLRKVETEHAAEMKAKQERTEAESIK
ncbi:MAG: hypothetical protein LBM01_04120 [Christensenellaceae bacterium]|jgi:hypothetical protein|nr:hypothetical protein [Christensenellaceae bacterium]